MIRAVLVCHGELSAALLTSAEEIVGHIPEVICISNRGKSPEIVRQEIIHAASENAGLSGVLVMADLFGSSCWRCAMEAARVGTGVPVAVVTGVNLGMLLSFSQKRDNMDFPTLASTMAEDGRRGINGPVFSSEGRT